MVVAAGTAERQAKVHLRDGADDVVPLVLQILRGLSRLVVPRTQAVEAGRDDGFCAGIVQFVSGQLLQDEAIVRLVLVQRIDDPVAVTPSLGLGSVPLIAVGVGVADQVQPVPRPSLAVAFSFQQPGSFTVEILRRRIGKERVLLGNRRWETDQVQVEPPQKISRSGGPGRSESL